jgi:hypothetical protein
LLSQSMQLLGAVLILSAYGAQQARKLVAESVGYQSLNALGGFLLCATAVIERQYGFILLEGAWAVLSVWGLARVLRQRED